MFSVDRLVPLPRPVAEGRLRPALPLFAWLAHGYVACHEHGTALSGFLPGSWDHLGCQLWDHPARLVGGCLVGSLTRHVRFVDVEVIQHGIQGGQCG